jgi:hypothetical protein
MSAASSHSNEFSKLKKKSSKSTFISINFTKLKGDLQLTLRTLCHFLLTMINFSKFYNVKQHFLR